MRVQESKEMYLETILILLKRNGTVRSIDIANEMSFSKPSVSRGMKILKEEQLILIDRHGFITLTNEGRVLAQNILDRHYHLKELLMLLGVDEEIAEENACRIEHVISDEVFSAIKEYLDK